MIKVVKGGASRYFLERCCFCRVETRYWYRENDVPCCPNCAKYALPKDVPSKRTWCLREEIAMLGAGVKFPPGTTRRGDIYRPPEDDQE